jgi:1-acyl-sn-glycerol-3-phosphate acyltransferase
MTEPSIEQRPVAPTDDVVIPLPPSAPRVGNAFTRWFGRLLLRAGGWRMVGEFPDEPKLMLIAAPHSSAWDAVWGMAFKLALGLKIEFMAKQEAFFWPLGALLRAFGGFPVNRRAAAGVVDQIADRFRREGSHWVVIAPEGTRRRVDKWKTGFWRAADAAQVPVVCVYFHYPERTVGIGMVLRTSGDVDADMARIRAWYRPWQGRNRGTT